MLTRPRPWFIGLAIWFAVLFWLSSQSRLEPPGPEFEGRDKILHVGYFALGGFLFFIGLRLKKPSLGWLAATLMTVAFCSAIGAFDEWHQTFTPNRSGNDPLDWTADTLGGLLGALGGQWLLPYLRKHTVVSTVGVADVSPGNGHPSVAGETPPTPTGQRPVFPADRRPR